jgi:hypothetical protein
MRFLTFSDIMTASRVPVKVTNDEPPLINALDLIERVTGRPRSSACTVNTCLYC